MTERCQNPECGHSKDNHDAVRCKGTHHSRRELANGYTANTWTQCPCTRFEPASEPPAEDALFTCIHCKHTRRSVRHPGPCPYLDGGNCEARPSAGAAELPSVLGPEGDGPPKRLVFIVDGEAQEFVVLPADVVGRVKALADRLAVVRCPLDHADIAAELHDIWAGLDALLAALPTEGASVMNEDRVVAALDAIASNLKQLVRLQGPCVHGSEVDYAWVREDGKVLLSAGTETWV